METLHSLGHFWVDSRDAIASKNLIPNDGRNAFLMLVIIRPTIESGTWGQARKKIKGIIFSLRKQNFHKLRKGVSTEKTNGFI